MLYLSGSEGEPALGFEPRTYGLQNRCTTTVLCRRGTERVEFCNAIFSLNQALNFKKTQKEQRQRKKDSQGGEWAAVFLETDILAFCGREDIQF